MIARAREKERALSNARARIVADGGLKKVGGIYLPYFENGWWKVQYVRNFSNVQNCSSMIEFYERISP